MHGVYTQRRRIADRSKDVPGWRQLPNRDQLLILGLCRLVDFLQVASFQTYVVFQLKTFQPMPSDASISWEVGLVQGSFTAAQCITAIIWGRLADAPWCGRKNVLLIGLISTAISCVGVAFATSVVQVVLWRAFGGGMNGTVGIIRTMISENVHEKRFQTSAFLILPLSFSIAGLTGPLLGGFLAEVGRRYSENYSNISVDASALQWLVSFPCALPSLLSAALMLAVTLAVFFCIKETLSTFKYKTDFGEPFWKRPIRTTHGDLQSLPASLDAEMELLRPSSSDSETAERVLPERPQLPFLRIFTTNVLFTFVSQAIFDFHLGAFASLWPLFLSSPQAVSVSLSASDSLHKRASQSASTGLNMAPGALGISMAVLGACGIVQQLLFYRPVQARLGSARCYQYFSLLFPLGYALTPGLLFLTNRIALWTGIVVVSCLLVTARTFTLPATIVLLNNCTPHPSVLGTVHGLGQSISACFRTIGPVAGGYWYGHSLPSGIAGESWWLVAFIACIGWLATFMVREGSGHEIFLPGDDDKVCQ